MAHAYPQQPILIRPGDIMTQEFLHKQQVLQSRQIIRDRDIAWKLVDMVARGEATVNDEKAMVELLEKVESVRNGDAEITLAELDEMVLLFINGVTITKTEVKMKEKKRLTKPQKHPRVKRSKEFGKNKRR